MKADLVPVAVRGLHQAVQITHNAPFCLAVDAAPVQLIDAILSIHLRSREQCLQRGWFR